MSKIYNKIGIGYNETRMADDFLVERIFDLLSPHDFSNHQKTYLDIGCGTGNYTIALAQRGLHFIGIEPSEKMLEIAKAKNDQMDWRYGHAEKIPLDNQSVDGAIGTLTMHHWTDLDKGFAEIFRVLKPGNRFVILTATPQQMTGYWLHHYFPKMLQTSMEVMPAFSVVESNLLNNGFTNIETEKYSV